MRVVFMGTPEFAVPSLRRLHTSGHELLLVVTQPDRPAGRGRRLSSPPVKQIAADLGIPVEQYETVNCEPFVERLRALAPEVLVVVAFGQILRGDILETPVAGAINVHASLLPAYRGVAPINWAIVNGERETGVTTMFMAKKVDAGEVIATRATPIGERETAGELSARLAQLGADLLIETLELVERGEAPRIPQDPSRASYARKLSREDGEIDWREPSWKLFDHIRGMTPWPGAFTWYRGKMLLVVRAAPATGAGTRGQAGEVLRVDDARGLEVAAGEGSIWLTTVKPEGKGEMDGGAFARGYRPEIGTTPFVRPEM